MTWNGRQLATATNGTNTISYSYDENGIRTQKTVNGVATNYNYHGSALISQVTGNDTLLFSYDANGNAAAVNYNGTYYYYVRNGQNDIIRLIDGDNNTVVEYAYDSWGRQISCTGSLASTLGAQNSFRYRGYVYDEETGFYYLQTRYYDPEAGRFINADIYVSTGQGVLGHNMYAYCGNNSIIRHDMQGNIWNTLAGALAGALVGGITSCLEGKSFWEGAGRGALTGAIAGAGLDITIATGGIGGVAIVAAAGAFSGALDEWMASDGQADVADYIIAATIGAATNLLSGCVGDVFVRRSINSLKEAIKVTIEEPIKKATRHFARHQVALGVRFLAGKVAFDTGCSVVLSGGSVIANKYMDNVQSVFER